MAAARAEPDPDKRRVMWRKAKSDRQRWLNQQRRQRDPNWWSEKLKRCAEYRRDQRHGRLSLCSGLPCESDSTV